MAAEAPTSIPYGLPKDTVDVRTAKYDVDDNGHVRHLITSEVYLHCPATPRSAVLVNGGSGATATCHDDVVENLLQYITTHMGPGRPVTGSALADTKFPRFVARSRFAQLLLLRDTGAGKFVFPLVHLRQLFDPTISAVYIALPAADEAVAKAAALDTGTYTESPPPPLGPTLPGYTVTLKLLVEDGDAWGHAGTITAPDFAPAMHSVSRTSLVPPTVPEDDSPSGLAAVTAATVAHYSTAHPAIMDMLTPAQRAGIRLGVGLASPVPPMRAASPSGAVFPSSAMNGGAIPLRTVKQLQDGKVCTVFLIVPTPAPVVPPAPTPVVTPAPTAPVPEPTPVEAVPEPEEAPPAAEATAPAPTTATPPPAAPVEVPLMVGDIVDAVSMDGAFTRQAEVKEVRPFGVMGDVTVTVLFQGAPFPFAGLPRSHILRVITPAWAREGAQ